MNSLIYKALGVLEMGATPEPVENVVVRVEATGICGTDLKTVYKGHRFFTPPCVLGHEFYGQISKAPEGYAFPVGSWVVVAPYFECGRCSWCLNGHGDLCNDKAYVSSGSFTEHVGIPDGYEKGIFALGHKVNAADYDVYALTEPLACVINGIQRLEAKPGYSKVLVVGGGPMGALFALYYGQMGIDVSIVEPSEVRSSILSGWGIDVVKQADVKPGDYDSVVIAVNKASLVGDYLPLVRKGGCLLVFSGLPKGESLIIDAGAVHYSEISIKGCSGFGLEHFSKAFETIKADEARYRKLITHKLNLKDGQKAFELLKDAGAFKILLGSRF
jgi:L-iditol 2-dehydrogenase